MTTISIPTAAPVRTAAAPTDTAGNDDTSAGDAFAATLERARESSKAPTDGLAKGTVKPSGKPAIDAKVQAQWQPRLESGSARELPADDTAETLASTAPDLPALLPGWPPVLLPAPQGVESVVAAAAAAAEPQIMSDRPALTEPGLPLPAPAAMASAMRSERPESGLGVHDEPATAPTARSSRTAANPPAAPTPANEPGLTMRPAKNAPDTPPLAPMTHPTMPSAPAAHAATAPPFVARLAAALDSPGFAPALATQITWLASGGVQQARLSLNPIEMGPLLVKIVLDGAQARIDFSADMAGTRAAIEASLPTLAAALHDSGLTLAGGGVFDGQARQGAQGGSGGRDARQTATAPGAAANPSAADAQGQARAPIRAARGLVDLVA
ncbi:MAG: flagellar hook-length control protein FliK [Burkholderiaceae bacterium]|nr:flagellar hook-length control protein FliK [Burkholderiaceae bacterium]